jgi:hypothetical protein
MEWRPGLLSDARQTFISFSAPTKKEALGLALGEKSGRRCGPRFSTYNLFQNPEYVLYVFVLAGSIGLARAGWMSASNGKALSAVRAQPGKRVEAEVKFFIFSAVTR